MVREVNTATHVPVQYRGGVDATKPKAQPRTPKRTTAWDVNPWTGEEDSKTYEEWRAHYDELRPKYPPFDAEREWKYLKLGFKIFVIAPLTILGALGLFSRQKE